MDSRSRVRSKPKLDSRSRVHGEPEADSAEGDVRPSQWREKYGSTPCTTKNQCGHEVKSSLTDWIATVRVNADKETKVFASLVSNSAPADEDAVDVISQMKKLLDGDDVLSCRHINIDLHDFDFHQNSDFDCADDFDTKFTSYFQASSMQAERQVNSALLIDPHEEAFSGESMAILFRRSHDEKITRKCFDCLLSITKENKLLRGRVFSSWKRIAKEAKDADDVLVRRFQRRHRLRHTRCLFSSWLNEGAVSHELLKRTAQIRVLRISHKVFIAWSKWSMLSRRKKRMDMASNIHSTRLKRSFFVRWLTSKRKYNYEVNSRKVESSPHEVKKTRSTVEEDDSSSDIGQTVTPERIAPSAMSEARDTLEPLVKQTTECVYGKKNQPMRTKGSNLLIPLNSQRRKIGIPSTPNLVLKMNQRKEEREKGRGVLRQIYEQKAIEKQKRLEEQRLQREEAETKVQREFVQRKTTEEQRKKMATEHQKRACRLAALHYQMSLQKHTLLQWKQVFQIQDFQERKASLAWSDTTYEKCWHGWLSFKNEEKRKRSERMLKYQQLADDLNERRLLAKSFAALEEQSNYSKSLLEEATRRVMAHRRKTMLTTWHLVASHRKTERCANADRAKRNGTRLTLLIAIHSWRCGVKSSQKERELSLLIEAKWEQWGLCRSRIG